MSVTLVTLCDEIEFRRILSLLSRVWFPNERIQTLQPVAHSALPGNFGLMSQSLRFRPAPHSFAWSAERRSQPAVSSSAMAAS